MATVAEKLSTVSPAPLPANFMLRDGKELA